MKLYKITNEFENILSQVGEDGEVSLDLSASLDLLSSEFETKAIAVASYIKNLEAEEAAINQAIDDMKTRKSSLSKRVESLSEYLQYNLQSMSITEIKSSPYFKIKLKRCPASVDVFNEELIPNEYIKQKVTTSVDKMKIKEDLNEGIEVPGATLQNKIKLEIK